jgi:hypothetical protein
MEGYIGDRKRIKLSGVALIQSGCGFTNIIAQIVLLYLSAFAEEKPDKYAVSCSTGFWSGVILLVIGLLNQSAANTKVSYKTIKHTIVLNLMMMIPISVVAIYVANMGLVPFTNAFRKMAFGTIIGSSGINFLTTLLFIYIFPWHVEGLASEAQRSGPRDYFYLFLMPNTAPKPSSPEDPPPKYETFNDNRV